MKSERRATQGKRPLNLDEAIRAFSANAAVEKTAAYVRSGRSLAGLTDDQLLDAWVERMRAFADEPDSYAAVAEADSELDLRGLEPPMDRARASIEKQQARLRAILEELEANPESLRENRKRFAEDIASFLIDREEATKH